jgi:hypothetical protein
MLHSCFIFIFLGLSVHVNKASIRKSHVKTNVFENCEVHLEWDVVEINPATESDDFTLNLDVCAVMATLCPRFHIYIFSLLIFLPQTPWWTVGWEHTLYHVTSALSSWGKHTHSPHCPSDTIGASQLAKAASFPGPTLHVKEFILT